MKQWFSNDPNGNGFVFHNTSAEAQLAAEYALEAERESAEDQEWSSEVEDICWGRLSAVVVKTSESPSESSRFDSIVDYSLVPIHLEKVQ